MSAQIEYTFKKRQPRLHDCGEHGRLTVQQIATKAGLSLTTINKRVQGGACGADLLKPRAWVCRAGDTFFATNRTEPSFNNHIFIACLMAQEYRAPPSVQQLQSRFSMSRATAYRWRRAWLEAQSIASARA